MEPSCDLLAIGQAESSSGFSRVFNSIFQYLSDTFKIVHFGINYRGEKIEHKWIIEPNRLRGDILGVFQLENLILKYRPKLIFICHDYWLYEAHKDVLTKYDLIAKTIFYCPIEYEIPDESRVSSFLRIGKLVFYTYYGLSTFQKEMTLIPSSISKVGLSNFEVIYHGVNRNLFHPIKSSKKSIRKNLFPDRPELWDSFIILNANRNVPRKRIDLTIQAFAKFLESDPQKCYLYLHMAKIDCGINLEGYINDLGIKKQIIFGNYSSNERPHVDDRTLNLIYNACDVGVNTSCGEGWGLIPFEHAAAGKCQILPNHTACKELWSSAARLIPVDDKNQIDVSDLANQFRNFYHDPELVKEQSRIAYQRILDPNLSWFNISKKWEKIFKEMLKV